MQPENNTRTCIKCSVAKPLADFYVYRKDGIEIGIMSSCKRCHAVSCRQWRLNNPERAKAVQDRADYNYKKKHLSDKEFQEYKRERRRRYYASPGGTATREAWKANRRDRMLFLWCRGRCKNHGITVERYEELLRLQNGVCAICHRPEERRGAKGGMWSLSIDHDHHCCSGRFGCAKCVRGLLCSKCNQAIALFSENPTLFQAAVDYLRRPLS